jgi:hypothetical protein
LIKLLKILTIFSFYFIYFCISGLPLTNVENPSNASSVTIGSESPFLSPPEFSRKKRKSPPTVGVYPICCLNCFECSDEFLKAEFESKTVKCKKCNHVANADEYEPGDFTKACLYDSKSSSTSGYKRHAETAYLSCLADCKRADNELEMIKLRKEELNIKKAEQERADIERTTRMDAELKLEETRQSTQQHLFKMQTEATAAMQEMLQSFIPKKSPLEKFREQKAAITGMLAAGEISNEVASQLMDELNSELLNSSLT